MEPEVDNQPDVDEEDVHPDVKRQREHIKNLEDKLKNQETLERELAFLKAGVDTDSKAGQLLFKAYDGDLEPDAIRSEAAELGLMEPPKAEEDEIPAEEREATDVRGSVATGAAPGADDRTENPRATALREGQKILEEGASREDAIGHAFAVLAEAGYRENDRRVIYDPREQ